MDAEAIAIGLRGKREGTGWIARCPAHNDSTPSLSISDGVNGKVLVHCFAGCSQQRVIDELMQRGLWRQKPQSNNSPSPKVQTTGRANFQRAQAIWQQSISANVTPVQNYLAARGIFLPLPETLRFHHQLRHKDGVGWPAMVGVVTGGTDNKLRAIHRTFLANDGSAKAPIDPQRMMLGSCRGGAVRLADAGEVLMVGEGIETCLSAMQATGIPAWAALSASGLVTLDLPCEVREIIILADRDEAGERTARDLQRPLEAHVLMHGFVNEAKAKMLLRAAKQSKSRNSASASSKVIPRSC